jgi:hypothetical protein
MRTWEVIKYLTENPNCDKVFVSVQNDKKYDIYVDDCSKDFIIDELPNGSNGWIFKTVFSNFEISKILKIDNWEW